MRDRCHQTEDAPWSRVKGRARDPGWRTRAGGCLECDSYSGEEREATRHPTGRTRYNAVTRYSQEMMEISNSETLQCCRLSRDVRRRQGSEGHDDEFVSPPTKCKVTARYAAGNPQEVIGDRELMPKQSAQCLF